MTQLLHTAVELARGAGVILRQAFAKAQSAVSYKTTVIDLVTDADRASEEFILEGIRRRFPDHVILAEESGASGTDGPCRWLVDPLDGTVNFAHRLPIFCVLLAVQERTTNGGYETVIGVTFDPLRDELFVAERGRGASLNGSPLRVSDTRRLIDALITTGFTYDRLLRDDDNHREFCRLNLITHGVRRLGSAGLDLAYVAAGRTDGFWEYGLKPWDMGAGLLMIEEAGGQLTTMEGRPVTLTARTVVGSNGHLHAPLLAALASAQSVPAASRDGLGDHLPDALAAELRARIKEDPPYD